MEEEKVIRDRAAGIAEQLVQNVTQAETRAILAGADIQKLDWHIQSLKNRLAGAVALREAFPSLPDSAKAEVIQLLYRSVR